MFRINDIIDKLSEDSFEYNFIRKMECLYYSIDTLNKWFNIHINGKYITIDKKIIWNEKFQNSFYEALFTLNISKEKFDEINYCLYGDDGDEEGSYNIIMQTVLLNAYKIYKDIK